MGYHTGADYSAPRGTPCVVVRSGSIVRSGHDSGFGGFLVLRAGGFDFWHCHLSEQTVKGGPVRAGQKIGEVDSTGNATGSHLHFEKRPAGGRFPSGVTSNWWPASGPPGSKSAMGGAEAARIVEWAVKQEQCFSEASDTTRRRFLTSFLATRTPSPDETFISGSHEIPVRTRCGRMASARSLSERTRTGAPPSRRRSGRRRSTPSSSSTCGMSATTFRKRVGEMR
nr:M23 family metallopeptidase [Streptomyces sp. M2CJ-2]